MVKEAEDNVLLRYCCTSLPFHLLSAVELVIAAAVRREWAGRQKSQHIIRTLTDFAGTHSTEHLNNALSGK